MSTDNAVTVYWRPGCPYCARLFRDLDSIGLTARKINIWDDARAAARVRSVAGGNETVPTVVVGDHAMVNPKATEVVEAAQAHDPNLMDELAPEKIAALSTGPWHAGALFTLAASAGWFALATGSPTTTYHFAPAVVAAAWPVGRRLRAGRALPLRAAAGAVLGGALLALIATVFVSASGALAGPALFGLPGPLAETLVSVAVGVVGGTVFALARRR
jgi:glutaredoxin-like protein